MIAHALTGLRVLLVLPCVLGFTRPDLLAPAWLLACIVLAIVTDLLDGAAARLLGTASAAGQLFDHATDCLFVASALGAAAYAGLLTPMLPLLVVLAFAQYVLDSRLLYRDPALRGSFLGRWNGVGYFVPVIVLAVALLDWPAGLSEPLFDAAEVLAWALVITTLLSMADRAWAGRQAG